MGKASLVIYLKQIFHHKGFPMVSFSDLFKGVLVGVANILPGVSGSALAVSMGIYGQIIHAMTDFPKHPKKSLQTLLPYIIGALCGVIGLSFTIEYLFSHYPLHTSLLFMGLILGGVPSIFSRAVKKGHTGSCIGVCATAFLLVTILSRADPSGSQPVSLAPSLSCGLKLFPLGILGAATMIIPGISGSMILMMMGYYQPLLSLVNDFLRNLAVLNLSSAWMDFRILLPFGFGILIGFFICAKVLDALMSHFGALTYCGILGLVLSSPIAILMEIPKQFFTMPGIVSGVLLFSASLIFTCWYSEKSS